MLNGFFKNTIGKIMVFILLPVFFINFILSRTNNKLSQISNDKCFSSDDPSKEYIEVFENILIKCEHLDAGQVAGIYSSTAAWISVLFLILALLWQSIQMQQTVRQFSTQLDWEKSKLVGDAVDNLRTIVKKYKLDPPEKLINETTFNTNSIIDLASFANKLILLGEQDFDRMQKVKPMFSSDKKEIHKAVKLICDLLENRRILLYTTLDHADKQALQSVLLNF